MIERMVPSASDVGVTRTRAEAALAVARKGIEQMRDIADILPDPAEAGLVIRRHAIEVLDRIDTIMEEGKR